MHGHMLFFRMKRWLAPVALLALLSACGDGEQAQREEVPDVTALVLKPQTVPYPMEYVGQTAGSREVQVRARVNGILQQKNYVEGSIVKQNDLLFTIEPDSYQAAYNDAKAALDQAQAAYTQNRLNNARILQLYSEAVVSKRERDDSVAAYEESLAAVNMAKARLDQAKINLGYTEVRAPITGITSKEAVTEGNLVNPSESSGLLTTIVQLDPLYVNFSIPGNEYLQFQEFQAQGRLKVPGEEGYTVEISLSNGQKYKTSGDLTFMDRQVDAPTGAIRARATLANPKAEILPGQFARVHVSGAFLINSILVPQRAVIKTQQGNMVYVIDDKSVANPRPIQIAMILGTDYLIENGLKAGERIMVEGILKARPNEHVKIVEPAKEANGKNKPAGGGQAQE